MLPKNTCFVIGAGSGFDLNMPLGIQLLAAIKESCNFQPNHGGYFSPEDELTREVFYERQALGGMKMRADANAILASNRYLYEGTPLIGSIDDYVNLHNDDAQLVRCAKLHIARAILWAERRSPLFRAAGHGQPVNISKLPDTWLHTFFRLISHPSNGVRAEDCLRNISIVNFNYDRCFEFYMIGALITIYHIQADNAAQLIREADIVHPYGQVGKLPALEAGGSVPFGGHNERQLGISEAAGSIKTYTEQVNSEVSGRVKTLVNAAEQIVCLGFGYHRQNIALLTPE